MKNILLFVLLVTMSASSFGQKIFFSDTTNLWNMYAVNASESMLVSYTYTNEYVGDTIIHGMSYKILNDYPTGYVREDTLLKKVYAIYTSDTASSEVLLYDYTLKLGDTFSTPYINCIVGSLDSLIISGLWYKTWHLLPYTPDSYGIDAYDVVEGIGSLYGPMSPFTELSFSETNVSLTCFTNNGVSPLLSKLVGNNFNNNCYTPPPKNVGVKEVNRNTQPAQLFPNPIDRSSKIVLPYKTSSASIIISNELGQTTINTTFRNTNEFTFGDKITAPGMYFYRVTDIESGQQFSGKFICR